MVKANTKQHSIQFFNNENLFSPKKIKKHKQFNNESEHFLPPKNTIHSEFIFEIPLGHSLIQIPNINPRHCSYPVKPKEATQTNKTFTLKIYTKKKQIETKYVFFHMLNPPTKKKKKLKLKA